LIETLKEDNIELKSYKDIVIKKFDCKSQRIRPPTELLLPEGEQVSINRSAPKRQRVENLSDDTPLIQKRGDEKRLIYKLVKENDAYLISADKIMQILIDE